MARYFQDPAVAAYGFFQVFAYPYLDTELTKALRLLGERPRPRDSFGKKLESLEWIVQTLGDEKESGQRTRREGIRSVEFQHLDETIRDIQLVQKFRNKYVHATVLWGGNASFCLTGPDGKPLPLDQCEIEANIDRIIRITTVLQHDTRILANDLRVAKEIQTRVEDILATLRMEGLEPTAEAKNLLWERARGEITADELVEQVSRLHSGSG